MLWQFTPYLIPLLIAGIVSSLMAILAWQRRAAPAARTVTVLMAAVALWCFSDAAQLSSTSLEMWHFWNYFTYIGVVTIPGAWLIYVLQTIGKDHWLKRRYLTLLAIEPVFTIAAIATDSLHHRFYTGVWMLTGDSFIKFNAFHGQFFWLHALYSYVLILAGTLLLIYAATHAPRAFRGQIFAALCAAIAPFIGNIVYLFQLSPWSYLDLTPFMFTISGVAMIWGLIRYQLLEIAPIARDRLIEMMGDAVLVLDKHNRIVDLNEAFARLIALPQANLVGHDIHEVLASWPGMAFCPEDPDSPDENVFSRPADGDHPETFFDLKVTQLFNRRNKLIGRLIVVRDITVQKHIEQENLLLYEAEHAQRMLAEGLRQSSETISSTLNIQEILDRLLEQAAEIVPYDSGSVILFEDNVAVVARMRGYEAMHLDPEREIAPITFKVDKTPNLRWIIENHQPLVIADTLDDTDWIRIPGTEYISSWLGVPMMARDQVIGLFSLDKADPNFYTAEHANRLSAFANQAAMALENARLFQETVESLRREQRLNDVARAISSTLEPDVVMPKIVKLACELVGADAGLLSLRDDRSDTIMAPYFYNFPNASTAFGLKRGEGLTWQILNTGESVLLDNYLDHPKARLQFAQAGRAYAFLGVPVSAGTERVGVLSLFHNRPGVTFSARDADLIEAVARQAGIAIQNTRLFQSAQQRAEEAETLREATAAVSSALDLDQVLDRILVNLEKVVPFDSATIFLLEGGNLRIRAGRGFTHPENLLDAHYPIENDLFLDCARASKGLVIEDAQQEPRFKHWGDSEHVHGWMGLPLQTRGQVIGLLTVDSRKVGAYTESDSVLAQAFANEAATALENARLFAEVQRLAITDPLTGLYNRRYFFDIARREFERAMRYQTPLAAIMIDIDDLKTINDHYGHLAGDQFVEMVAEKSQEVLRSVDIVARYAGDEFIILLPETGREGAMQAAERVRKAVSSTTLLVADGRMFGSLSIGVAELTLDCATLDTLVDRADRALYLSKRAGKNLVTLYTEDFSANSRGTYVDAR